MNEELDCGKRDEDRTLEAVVVRYENVNPAALVTDKER